MRWLAGRASDLGTCVDGECPPAAQRSTRGCQRSACARSDEPLDTGLVFHNRRIGDARRGALGHAARLVGTQFSQPTSIRAVRDPLGVPLDRPPRVATGAVTARVRHAILVAASRMDFHAAALLDRHARAESLAEVRDIVDDVEERYRLEPKSLLSDPQTQLRLGRIEAGRSLLSAVTRMELYAECILYALPDTEFLAVIEHAVAGGAPSFVTGGEDLADAAGEILEAHGLSLIHI